MGDISVTQKNGMPFVAGALNLEDLYIGLTSVPSFGSGGSPIGLDFTVDLGEKMHLHTASFYDIWGGGKIHLGGNDSRSGHYRRHQSDKGDPQLPQYPPLGWAAASSLGRSEERLRPTLI